jgi:hypothetical protein
MPNTRSKSRNCDGSKSKYMRYESSGNESKDDGAVLMGSFPMNGLKNCSGNTTDLAQQETGGLYKVHCICSFVQCHSYHLTFSLRNMISNLELYMNTNSSGAIYSRRYSQLSSNFSASHVIPAWTQKTKSCKFGLVRAVWKLMRVRTSNHKRRAKKYFMLDGLKSKSSKSSCIYRRASSSWRVLLSCAENAVKHLSHVTRPSFVCQSHRSISYTLVKFS